MQIKNIFLIFFIFLFVIYPIFAKLISPPAVNPLEDFLKKILEYVIGPDHLNSILVSIPLAASDKLFVYGVLFLVFITFPLITIYAIVFGFLMELRIFRSKAINFTIAFTMSTTVIFIPIPFLGSTLFGIFIGYLFSIAVWWIILIFLALVFVGACAFYKIKNNKSGIGSAVYSAYKDEAKSLRFELRTTNEAIADVMRKMAKETDPAKRAALESTLQTLSDRRNDISDRITQMEQIRKRL